MFCQRCGAQLPENTSKCPYCGAEYNVEGKNVSEANKKTVLKSFSIKKRIVITAIIAVILIASGIAAVITLSEGSLISVSTTDMLQLADRYLNPQNKPSKKPTQRA